MSETDTYGPIMLATSKLGCRLFRNHVGMSKHGDRKVKTGLAPGSSDLIGWTHDGRFLAMEVKPEGWKITPSYEKSKYGKRQIAFLKAVRDAGGVAGFVTSVTDAVTLVTQQ